MSRISMDETSGCLSWLAAYCLGSYLFLGIVVQTLDPRLLVVAPLFAPWGILLAANYVTWPVWLLLVGSWSLSIVGCLGLIRAWQYGRWRWWPLAVLAGGLALPWLAVRAGGFRLP